MPVRPAVTQKWLDYTVSKDPELFWCTSENTFCKQLTCHQQVVCWLNEPEGLCPYLYKPENMVEGR